MPGRLEAVALVIASGHERQRGKSRWGGGGWQRWHKSILQDLVHSRRKMCRNLVCACWSLREIHVRDGSGDKQHWDNPRLFPRGIARCIAIEWPRWERVSGTSPSSWPTSRSKTVCLEAFWKSTVERVWPQRGKRSFWMFLTIDGGGEQHYGPPHASFTEWAGGNERRIKKSVHTEILGPRQAAGTIEGENESRQVIWNNLK